MKKNILITGANKGIGLETIRQLAAMGHEVILTARNQQRGIAAKKKLFNQGLAVHFIQMDVNEKAHLQSAKTTIQNRFGKLDVLINNAAISNSSDTSILEFDEEVLYKTMQTNAFSILLMVASFAPMMRSGGRIINFSSGLGSMTDPVNGWSPIYSCSKSLVNAVTRQQAYFLSAKGIVVVAMCPGWVRTDMGGAAAPLHVSEGADTAVWLATAESIETGKFYRNRKVIPW